MTFADYKTERQRRGTLKGVAALLGIHWTTLARRESGVIELTTEMALAIRSLPLRKPKRPASTPLPALGTTVNPFIPCKTPPSNGPTTP